MKDSQTKSFLGFIPARGGSKGIPDKCIKPLLGKPLIAYTIEAALKSNYLDRIIISTEDERIAEVARQFGSEVPFLRPKELATDSTPTLPVIQHGLRCLQEQGYSPDFVVLLQPTSPLRQFRHIDQAIEKILQTQADAVVSLCPGHYHPFWMKRVLENDRVLPFMETDREYLRRQDLPPVYELNGAVGVVKREVILENRRAIDQDIRAIFMEDIYSIDIDTPLDFFMAEKLMEKLQKDEE